MLSNYISDIGTQERLRCESFGADLDGFAAWLTSRRYSPNTIRSYLLAATKFSAWMHANNFQAPAVMDKSRLLTYRSYLRQGRQGKRAHEGGNAYCGARRFAQFLRENSEVTVDISPTAPALEARFCHWLHQHRGLADATISSYLCKVRRLLEALGNDPRLYTAAQLRAFVLTQSRGYSHSHIDCIVTSVRMFVRFLIAHQECPEGLQYAIPRVAGWRRTSLPRYIDPADIQRVVDACDPSDPLGARDHAVLLLLARLGLRAGDIASLRLSDIDWVGSRLRVTGKSRQAAWLPLPQEVGDALLHYIQTARPAVGGDGLFLITHAPYTPIIPKQVSSTTERAIRRAGIKAPSHGAHMFRHSAATAWLRQGMSLQAIGAVLRHSDIDTT